MQIGEVKKFVESRLDRGLGEKDVRDLKKLVAPDGEISARGAKQLEKIAKEYGDKFTAAGARTLEDIAGIKLKKSHSASSSGGVVGVRSKDLLPEEWHKYTVSGAVAALKKNESDENTLYYRVPNGDPNGNLVGLDPKNYSDLVKSGAMTLYKNPHEEQVETDDDGGWAWSSSLILVPNPKSDFGKIGQDLDALVKSGSKVSETWDKAQSAFHSAVHASNFNNNIPDTQRPAWAKNKAKGEAARPAFEKAIAETEAASAKWNTKADALRAKVASSPFKDLVENALGSSKPNLDPVSIGLAEAQQYLDAQKVLFPRAEVLSVDPGFDGLRVQIDSLKLFDDGGTMKGYEAAMRKALAEKAPSVKMEASVEDANSESAIVAAMIDRFVAPAVGKKHLENVGWSSGTDQPLELSFPPETLAAANQNKAKMQDFLSKVGQEDWSKHLKIKAE